MRTPLLICAALSVAATACVQREELPPTIEQPVASCGEGETYTYVLSTADVARADNDEQIAGFNIDGEVTELDPGAGCGVRDRPSPPPDQIEGVDNQLGIFAPGMEQYVDIRETIDLAIVEGKLAVMFQLSAVDDLQDDECVDLRIGLGYPADGSYIAIDEDGRVAPGLIFDMVPWLSVPASIVDGRLHAQEFRLRGTLDFVSPPLGIDFQSAQMRFDVHPDRLSRGVVGGAIPIRVLLDAVDRIDPKYLELAKSLFEANADVDVDGQECNGLSGAFVFEAVTAEVGETL